MNKNEILKRLDEIATAMHEVVNLHEENESNEIGNMIHVVFEMLDEKFAKEYELLDS